MPKFTLSIEAERLTFAKVGRLSRDAKTAFFGGSYSKASQNSYKLEPNTN
jgi:hypothetical protein